MTSSKRRASPVAFAFRKILRHNFTPGPDLFGGRASRLWHSSSRKGCSGSSSTNRGIPSGRVRNSRSVMPSMTRRSRTRLGWIVSEGPTAGCIQCGRVACRTIGNCRSRSAWAPNLRMAIATSWLPSLCRLEKTGFTFAETQARTPVLQRYTRVSNRRTPSANTSSGVSRLSTKYASSSKS